MKKLSLSLLALALFVFVASQQAQAFSSIKVNDIDQAMSMVGRSGAVIQGKVTKVEKTRLDNGWSAVSCTIEGEVLKGNETCPAKEGVQTCVVKMVDTVRGLNICRAGMEGFLCLYGTGKYGGTSFTANGDCNSYLETAPDGSKYIQATRYQFKNKSFESKMIQSLPTVGKALGSPSAASTTGAAAPGTLSADQVQKMYRYMIDQMYSK